MRMTCSSRILCGALLGLALAAGTAGASQPERAVLTHELAEAKIHAALGAMPFASPPTANQQAFDVTAYDLDLQPNVAAHVLWASARVRARVVLSPLFSMELDLDDAMTVDSVKVADAPCTFTHLTDLLTISFGRPYLLNEPIDLTVWYHGTPPSGAFGTVFAMQTRNGKPLVWTLSEPYGARAWWPCKDHPEDKADSVSVRVTVASGMKTVSNGRRVEASDDGSVAVTRWVERHPIATYLVSIASYDYAVFSDWYRPAPGDSMEIVFYEFAEDTALSRTVNAEVKGMIAAYAARFGPYPFLDEKYGEAEFTWGGGMENQTITSLGNPASEYTVAHELAHMWWGDAVTCRDFHHIWLNEGFASYGPALWYEAQSGLLAYHSFMAGIEYFGAGTIYVPNDDDPARIFNGYLSYDKGAWVLHMLRHVLGDTLFFQSLRAYGAAHAYGTATTEDLRAACEAVTGRDLGAFFQEWIYGEYYPQYGYRWASAAAGVGWDVTVELTQMQGWQLFWMPVDVRIQTAGGAQTFVAMDSLAAQSFVFHVDQAPLSVAIDPDEWILRSTSALAVEPMAGARLEFLPPRPNPSRGATSFAFVLPDPRAPRAGARGEARLEIFDPRGALVRALETGPLGAGPQALVWDGRDRGGRPVAPGVYEARLTAGGAARSRRIVVVR